QSLVSSNEWLVLIREPLLGLTSSTSPVLLFFVFRLYLLNSLIRLPFLDHSIKLSTFVTKLNALHLMRPPGQKLSERDHLNHARIQLAFPIALEKQKLHSHHLLDEHVELRYEGRKHNMAHAYHLLRALPQHR